MNSLNIVGWSAVMAMGVALVAASRATGEPISTRENQNANFKRDIRSIPAENSHWSFIPPNRPPLPRLSDLDGSQNAIDAFVRARLAGEGLEASGEAGWRTLIRRLSLDLIGLPLIL